jgi:hypothetical protein
MGVQRVASFAGLDLDELGDEVQPLTLGEPRQRLPLRFDPKPDRPCWLVLTRT